MFLNGKFFPCFRASIIDIDSKTTSSVVPAGKQPQLLVKYQQTSGQGLVQRVTRLKHRSRTTTVGHRGGGWNFGSAEDARGPAQQPRGLLLQERGEEQTRIEVRHSAGDRGQGSQAVQLRPGSPPEEAQPSLTDSHPADHHDLPDSSGNDTQCRGRLRQGCSRRRTRGRGRGRSAGRGCPRHGQFHSILSPRYCSRSLLELDQSRKSSLDSFMKILISL